MVRSSLLVLPVPPAMLLACALSLGAQQGDPGPSQVAPLFRSTEPLELRLEADFRTIRRDREEESEELPGQVVLVHPDGTEETFPAQIRTRGRFRLASNTCSFPPIRVNFPKGEVEGSVFDGQDKIKLVTHCRDSERYEQNVVKEYLVYRLYNVLTPLSFQVRMARITYVDTSGREEAVTRLAFFIEMEESLAERMGGEVMPDSIQGYGIHPALIQTDDAARVDLFQYMVGNTDFSLYGAPGTAPHNSVPVGLGVGRIIPVPYDFDWTGFVSAPYARPDPSAGIRNVRQRVYRGLCRPSLDYEALYAAFQARREDLTAVVRDEPLLAEGERKEALEYLDDFWETLENERNRTRRIQEACRPV